MRVAELKYFQTENLQRMVENQSKSLNLYSHTADLFQQNRILVSQQLRTPKSRFIKIKKRINELMFNIYSR